MQLGLTMLSLEVETENGEEFFIGIDRYKTIIGHPDEDERYPLISSGPIAIGMPLRGIYVKKREEYSFQSTNVTNIVATFTTNRVFK